MGAVYQCSSTRHQGDADSRLIRGLHGFTARLDYRSLDGTSRPHSKELRVVCYACMEAEWAEVVGRLGEQLDLFGGELV